MGRHDRYNDDMVRRVLDMSKQKRTAEEIAAEVGISRDIVYRVRKRHGVNATERYVSRSEGLYVPKAAECNRCPTCGGLVLLPCRLCRHRAKLARLSA